MSAIKDDRLPSRSTHKQFWLYAAICSALVVASIWAPFGFAMGGLIEEWGFLGVTNQWRKSLVDFIRTSSLGAFATRPLFTFPFALAHFLSPNSFTAWHVLTILELFIKGVAAAYLIRNAVRSDLLALLGGVIAIVFPADTMTIAFRGLHINFAMMLLLVGASLSVADLVSDTSRHLLSILGAASALAAFLIYEAALTLIILPLMVVFIRLGIRGTLHNLRTKAASHAIWFSSAATYFGYVADHQALHAAVLSSEHLPLLGRRARDDIERPKSGVHHRLSAHAMGRLA